MIPQLAESKVQSRLDKLNQQVKIVDKNTAEAENN